jgi:hypothetical protein
MKSTVDIVEDIKEAHELYVAEIKREAKHIGSPAKALTNEYLADIDLRTKQYLTNIAFLTQDPEEEEEDDEFEN